MDFLDSGVLFPGRIGKGDELLVHILIGAAVLAVDDDPVTVGETSPVSVLSRGMKTERHKQQKSEPHTVFLPSNWFWFVARADPGF